MRRIDKSEQDMSQLGGGSYRFACRKAYPGLVPLRRGERRMLSCCGLSAVLETAPQRARM